VIAGKWKVKILCHLFDGTKRFSEQRRLLLGVHRGTLTYELRGLQGGMIHRTQYPPYRRGVEYNLTARGAALRPVLIALQRWSNTEKLEVPASRADKSDQSGR